MNQSITTESLHYQAFLGWALVIVVCLFLMCLAVCGLLHMAREQMEAQKPAMPLKLKREGQTADRPSSFKCLQKTEA